MTLILLFVSFLQMPSRDVSLASALAELNQGRVLESIKQFREILRSDPANAPAYFYLSSLYTEMGELEAAERYLGRAMEANPGQGLHQYQLGLIRSRQKHWQAALGFFKQALQLGAGTSEAAVWRAIGEAQVQLFDRDSALEAYETALRLQPKDAATRLALGRFHLDRNEPDRAIVHLQAAIEINPSLTAAYPVLGLAFRHSGNLQSGMTILKKALDMNPADQESRYALGHLLLAMGRMDEGRAELARYENIRQQVAAANNKYDTAIALIETGQVAQAEQVLQEAVRLAPTYAPALNSLGVLLLNRESMEEAVHFLQRAVEANALNAASWFTLGMAYFKSGKISEALEAVKQATTLNENDDRYQQLLLEIQARVRK